MTEYYIIVEPEGIGAPYTYKSPSRLWAEWLKNQLKRLGHKVKVEKTQGGSF